MRALWGGDPCVARKKAAFATSTHVPTRSHSARALLCLTSFTNGPDVFENVIPPASVRFTPATLQTRRTRTEYQHCTAPTERKKETDFLFTSRKMLRVPACQLFCDREKSCRRAPCLSLLARQQRGDKRANSSNCARRPCEKLWGETTSRRRRAATQRIQSAPVGRVAWKWRLPGQESSAARRTQIYLSIPRSLPGPAASSRIRRRPVHDPRIGERTAR